VALIKFVANTAGFNSLNGMKALSADE
jgi:hypothetical protein